MTRTPGVMTAMLLVFAACLGAQQKPDFSGEWTLNRSESRLQGHSFERLESAVLRIEHREPHFSFSRIFIMSGRASEYSSQLTTDGREVASLQGDQELVSALSWDGDALVYCTRFEVSAGQATNSLRFQLRDGGRALEATESLRAPDLSYDNVWVFDRKD